LSMERVPRPDRAVKISATCWHRNIPAHVSRSGRRSDQVGGWGQPFNVQMMRHSGTITRKAVPAPRGSVAA